MTYNLSLVGTKGFTLGSQSVSLVRGKATTVNVTATTPAAGAAMSAVLKVDNPSTNGVDFQVMNVVAAGDAIVGPDYTKSWSGSMGRSEPQRFYLTVPPGVKALQLNLSGVTAGSQTRFLAFHPYGVGMEEGSSLVCYTNFQGGNGCNPDAAGLREPAARRLGVPGRVAPHVAARTTTRSRSRPRCSASPSTRRPRRSRQAARVSWNVTNNFGPVTATAAGGPLGSAFASRESIADGGTKEYTVTVPTGATRLDVSIGNTSDAQADLDLYVTDPAGEQLYDADGDSEESLTYANPAPGDYTVLVDGYDVPAGTTQFDYLDVFFSSALGTLSVTSRPVRRLTRRASTKTITGTLTAGHPAGGRPVGLR